MTDYKQSPFAPGVSQDQFLPDQLIAGDMKIVTKNVTILSGEGALVRGTVLGKAGIGGATAAAKAGGNTGNGTLVMDVTTPVLANAKPGVYSARFRGTTLIRLEDGDGDVIADIAIGGSTGNTAQIAEQVKGVVTQGATPFADTDGFDITVPEGSGKYRKAVAANVDGSAVPDAILVDDVDATSADKIAGVYQQGEFNANKITLGAGVSLAAARDAFRTRGIFLKDTVSAADPS